MRPPRVEPGPGQESVWDYPRPPVLDPTESRITVSYGDDSLADTTQAIRVLETSQPPAFYLPRNDVNFEWLHPSTTRTYCELKGEATFYDLTHGDVLLSDVAWTYRTPNKDFEPITNYLAFYAQKLECRVDGEVATANEGHFYGGWITSKVVGPFKGGPGTAWW